MQILLDDFEVIKRLSPENKNKFGEVFLVRNKVRGDLFVLKSIGKNRTSKLGLLRLQNEAKFSFDYKGLPKDISFFESEESYHLLRPFEEGIPLAKYWKGIRKKNRIKEIKAIFNALAPILCHLEENRSVHGDLSPSNILINKQENDIYCSLIDFGLSYDIDNKERRGTTFSLTYSAPEMILNSVENIDIRTDIYSLGLILYKLYTGGNVFEHSNPNVLTQMYITYPLEKPWGMPKELFTLIEKACAKHYFKRSPNQYKKLDLIAWLEDGMKNRYANYSDFIEDIEKLNALRFHQRISRRIPTFKPR
jgi:serine/threonine protein kinase